MTSDGRLPVDQRRNYKHVFDALYRITKEEGVLALWRVCKNVTCLVPDNLPLQGCGPTVARAMVVNAAQLASYSQAKQFLLSTGMHHNVVMDHVIT